MKMKIGKGTFNVRPTWVLIRARLRWAFVPTPANLSALATEIERAKIEVVPSSGLIKVPE